MIWDRFDSEHKKVILLCLGLFILFGLFGFLSEGTHNDDDITRYLNSRAALHDGNQFLSRWNRPGFILLYFLPAQLGYWAVELLTALLSALTCYFVYRTAKVLGEDKAPLAAFFTAFQPFFFALSFSALTEPLGAFLLSASLYLLSSRRYFSSALVAAALPLARLELSIIVVLWAVRYVGARSWKSIIVLPLGVFAWNVAGFIATGDALYLLHEVFTGAERIYDSVVFFHYPRGYIYIVGPIIFALSIIGLVNSIRRRQLVIIWAGLLVMFAAYTYLSIGSSAGQAAGFLRYIVSISPLIALLALRGFHQWCKEKPSLTVVVILLASTAICWLFLSFKIHALKPGQEPEYVKVAMLGIMTLAALVLRFFPKLLPWRRAGKVLPAFTVLLCISYNFSIGQVIRLSPERQTIKKVADWYLENGLEDRVTLCNHDWFYYFTKLNHLDRDRHPLLTKENLKKAPPGAIAIWEGHYAHRLIGDVSSTDMQSFRTYRVLKRIIAESGIGFFTVILEKTGEEESRGILSEDTYRHPGFGVRWDLRNLNQWDFAIQTDRTKLLKGRHPSGIRFDLALNRYFRMAPGQFLKVTEEQLGKRHGIRITQSEARGHWHWIWGEQETQEFALGIGFSPERCSALYLAVFFPPEMRSRVRSELATMVSGLGFEPLRIHSAR